MAKICLQLVCTISKRASTHVWYLSTLTHISKRKQVAFYDKAISYKHEFMSQSLQQTTHLPAKTNLHCRTNLANSGFPLCDPYSKHYIALFEHLPKLLLPCKALKARKQWLATDGPAKLFFLTESFEWGEDSGHTTFPSQLWSRGGINLDLNSLMPETCCHDTSIKQLHEEQHWECP